MGTYFHHDLCDRSRPLNPDNSMDTSFTQLTDDEFSSTYGEQALLRGSFDVAAAAKYKCAAVSCLLCTTVGGIPFIPCVACCYPAIKKSVASQRLTLGEHSLFYSSNTYCCCGPCSVNCNTSEQQVPLDKLQDLRLQQNWCARLCGIWQMSMETAGQAGNQAGPELAFVGLNDPRQFKQEVLARRNQVAVGGAMVVPPRVPCDANDIVPILLRIDEKLGALQSNGLKGQL